VCARVCLRARTCVHVQYGPRLASSTTHSGLADLGWGCVAAKVCLRVDDKAHLQQRPLPDYSVDIELQGRAGAGAQVSSLHCQKTSI